MLALNEKQMLIEALGRVVVDEVRAATRPLQDRITQLEKAIGDMPVPKDGKDGVDGADGKSLCLDEIRGCVTDLVAQAVSRIPVQPHCTGGIIDRDGALSLTFSNGTLKNMGQVVGRDGKDGEPGAQGEAGRDGVDGLGIEQIEFDGERTFRLANEKIDRSFTIPYPLYQGLWKPGAYVRGDEVTSDGSQFIAMRDTDKEPGTIDSGWRLACKRGQNGKAGKDSKDGGKI